MKQYLAVAAAVFFAMSTAVGAATDPTKREQCERKCTSELLSCAKQVASYCEQRKTAADGCLNSAKDKCKSGGVKSDGVYRNCINRCVGRKVVR